MDFGVSFVLDDVTRYGEVAREVEASGFAFLGVPDTAVYREMTVALTVAALHTRRLRLGPLVSNPLTRHPLVAAAAMASLRDLAGDRLFWGLSTGDTAVATAGLRPAPLAVLREYVETVRALLAGQEAAYGERRLRLPWARHPVPVYLAADGPRGTRLAGEVADGLVSGMGVSPEVVALVRGYVAEGAQRAGRDPAEVAVWSRAAVALGPHRERCVDDVKPALAAAAHHAFRGPLEGKAVPPEVAAKVPALEAGYAVHAHSRVGGDNPNARLVDGLGLTDYLLARFAVVGTPREAAARLRELAAGGVTHLTLRPMARDKLEFLRLWRQVLEHL